MWCESEINRYSTKSINFIWMKVHISICGFEYLQFLKLYIDSLIHVSTFYIRNVKSNAKLDNYELLRSF